MFLRKITEAFAYPFTPEQTFEDARQALLTVGGTKGQRWAIPHPGVALQSGRGLGFTPTAAQPASHAASPADPPTGSAPAAAA